MTSVSLNQICWPLLPQRSLSLLYSASYYRSVRVSRRGQLLWPLGPLFFSFTCRLLMHTTHGLYNVEEIKKHLQWPLENSAIAIKISLWLQLFGSLCLGAHGRPQKNKQFKGIRVQHNINWVNYCIRTAASLAQWLIHWPLNTLFLWL